MFASCDNASNSYAKNIAVYTNEKPPHYNTIEQIPLPVGYTRTTAETESFAAWLRKTSLKTDNTVYLFDGKKKKINQRNLPYWIFLLAKKTCSNVPMQ